MRQAEKEGLAAPALKRLKFDEHKLGDVCAGLEQLAAMDDPIGQEHCAPSWPTVWCSRASAAPSA
ncbi:MAG: hypothetical protein ACLUI3_13040 [Christensenellales bacterium]